MRSEESFVERGSLPAGVRVGAVLLHGLTGMPSEMRPVARYLNKLGIESDAPTLAGHGGTYKDMQSAGWKDWLAGATEAVEAMSKRVDKVIVVGLSMGALVATCIAAKNPKVSGIVLMSTALEYDGENVRRKLHRLLPLVDIFPFLGDIFYWTEEPPYGLKDERLQRMITREIEKCKSESKADFGAFRTYAGSLRQLQLLVKHVKKQAPQVRCPALLMHSVEDSLTTARNSIEMHSYLGSTDKEFKLLSGCDHVMTLDLRKNEVAQMIGDFIVRVSRDEPGPFAEAPLQPARTLSTELSFAGRLSAV